MIQDALAIGVVLFIVIVPKRVTRNHRWNMDAAVRGRRRFHVPFQGVSFPRIVASDPPCAETHEEVDDAEQDANSQNEGADS